jgi:membrane peptidoglycan carboxypeptidase
MRDALRFSLNIPAVKAVSVIGTGRIQAKAEEMGVRFLGGPTDAGLSFALGVEEVHPADLVRAYGTLADGGLLAEQTTIRTVVDSKGTTLVSEAERPAPTQAIGAGAAGIMTDILAGNTDPRQNPYWGKFQITDGDKRRPATLKTGTNNDAKDLSAYGYIAPPAAADRDQGQYALAVGVWNGNSDNTVISTSGTAVFSLDVSTYVWQGFLKEATKGWAIQDFTRPGGLQTAAVDPWTGLVADAGAPAVQELFLDGTAPSTSVPQDARCGAAVLQTAGFERDHEAWLVADRAWLTRAERGIGVRDGPKGTLTSYFYNRSYNPYGKSWGPLLGEGGCPTPTPSVSIDPCATPLDSGGLPASLDPFASPAPSSDVVCPSPSESPTDVPSEAPTPTVTPTPTPAPTGGTPAPTGGTPPPPSPTAAPSVPVPSPSPASTKAGPAATTSPPA